MRFILQSHLPQAEGRPSRHGATTPNTTLPSQPGLRLLLLVAIIVTLPGLQIGSCIRASAYTQSALPPTQIPYMVDNITYFPIPDAVGFWQTGIASWYGSEFHGRSTSNGEQYDMYHYTAAHKILPMNTMVLVTDLDNGRQIVVRINDRGPFIRGRIIDLSYEAAKRLRMIGQGTARVRIVALAKKSQFAAFNHGVSRLPDLHHGTYFVQIGSFNRLPYAHRLQQRFIDAGHNAVIRKYHDAKQIFYRVQVYVGKELGRARKAASILLDLGYRGAFIVAQ